MPHDYGILWRLTDWRKSVEVPDGTTSDIPVKDVEGAASERCRCSREWLPEKERESCIDTEEARL